MRRTAILAILVLALGLMVLPASVVSGAQYLTVNGQDVTSITLELGQSHTVEVVSTDNTPYVDYVGFDNGAVLGDFSHLETKAEAGDLAAVVEYDQPAFYGYYVNATGISPAPSAGVHFVFEYVGLQLGETDVKLYDGTLTSVIDSIHITVIRPKMGTAFSYQGQLIDDNEAADGIYDFQLKLYDYESGGSQLGSTIDINDLDVINGQFALKLDFGSGIFDGNAVWLETTVADGDGNDPCTLTPRTELTPTPYALYAATVGVPLELSGSSDDPIISATNSGTGYAGNFEQTGSSNDNGGLNVTTAAGQYGAKILNQGGCSGYSYGLQVTTEKDTGSYIPGNYAYGIQSIASHNNSAAYGLRADANSTNSLACGGYFRALAGGSYSRGIYIDADNTMATAGGYSYGLHLYSDCANGTPYGIYSGAYTGSGSTSPLYGIYSYGRHLGTSGTSYGMYSKVYGSNEGDSYGIYSYGSKYSSDTVGKAYGGYFIGDNDANGGESYGLYTKATGLNGKRYGLYSDVTTSSGYYSNYGLYTKVANDNLSYGLYADVDPGTFGFGVFLDLDTTTACRNDQRGLYSDVDHRGTNGAVYGVQSYTHSSDTGANYAGYFRAYSSTGDTGNLYGIYARCSSSTIGEKYAGYFYKDGGGNYAGYFDGNVHITGTLTKSSGSFKIDHPLDPENKYLSHSFVESPDMMNVYNGNAVLDKTGEAVVKLPEYFEALNQDFRYQLTCIGGFAPVYVAEEISENRFKIAGGKRGMKVSWQVTGVRHDPYAVAHRVQVEEEKKDEERGYYLNPMAYGLPEEKGIESVRNPQLSETHQVAKGDVSYETD